MDLTLTPRQLDLKRRAAELTEFIMQFEDECERTDTLSAQALRAIYEKSVELGLNAMNIPKELGGEGFSYVDQVVVKEEYGKLSNGLWWLVWTPANALVHGTPEQLERYLMPTIRGERHEAFAVTEPGAGSDPASIVTSARETADGYVINGEKWFVTAGDYADYLIVQAKVQPGDRHTLFLIDKDTPGVRTKREPHFMHTFVFGHPEIVFEDVFVPKSAVLGEVGGGFDLTKAWFLDARLSIGVHTTAAAERCIRIATDYAMERHTFGRRLIENQFISGMIVDSAIDIATNRALCYQVAWEADHGISRKLLHAKGAMLKVSCAEAAGRVVDRSLQILGGRGYMRDSPVERLYRDLRVDRIWEGSSETQRIVLANEVQKRGFDGIIVHPGLRPEFAPESPNGEPALTPSGRA